jgi:hypothetical protein
MYDYDIIEIKYNILKADRVELLWKKPIPSSNISEVF